MRIFLPQYFLLYRKFQKIDDYPYKKETRLVQITLNALANTFKVIKARL